MLSRLEDEFRSNAMFDRFETISWAGNRPDDHGYVFRAPADLRVVCHPPVRLSALPARRRVTIEATIDGEEPAVGPRGIAVDDLRNESGRSFRLVPTRDADVIRPP